MFFKPKHPLKRIVKSKRKLSKPCREVCPIEDQELIAKVSSELKYCAKVLSVIPPQGCLGLAANQLGYKVRIIVVKTSKGWEVFINPTWEGIGFQFREKEGCLSFPGVTVYPFRFKKIKVWSEKPYRKSRILMGREAQAFQHELDHLDGKLI